jgi:hypothetical protein
MFSLATNWSSTGIIHGTMERLHGFHVPYLDQKLVLLIDGAIVFIRLIRR